MQPWPRHPGKPSGFGVKCTSSADDLWVTKQTITYEGWPSYTVSSVEFEDGGWSTRRGISPDCLPRRNGVATSSHRCIDPRPISGGRVTGCPSSEPSLTDRLPDLPLRLARSKRRRWRQRCMRPQRPAWQGESLRPVLPQISEERFRAMRLQQVPPLWTPRC
jgi:hypothetical protein